MALVLESVKTLRHNHNRSVTLYYQACMVLDHNDANAS